MHLPDEVKPKASKMSMHSTLESNRTTSEAPQPWIGVTATGPVLRPAQAAAYYGVSLSTYYEMIKAGELPPFVKLGRRSRASGVPRAWLDAVIVSRASAGNVEAH